MDPRQPKRHVCLGTECNMEYACVVYWEKNGIRFYMLYQLKLADISQSDLVTICKCCENRTGIYVITCVA